MSLLVSVEHLWGEIVFAEGCKLPSSFRINSLRYREICQGLLLHTLSLLPLKTFLTINTRERTLVVGKKKGKAVPLQAWSGPEGSRKLRLPDFMTTAQDGGKVVSLAHRPPLPPGNAPGTHFC